MRVSMSVAGLALVLAACGGDKKAEEAPAAATPAAEAPAAAPAAGGTKHDISMELVGSDYKFVPEETTSSSTRTASRPAPLPPSMPA